MSVAAEHASTHYSNAFRYAQAPLWFDFYNCRVLIPEQRLYFFTMPYVLSGDEVPAGRRGLFFYDGGNGGPQPGSRCGWERIADRDWSASRERCEVHWKRRGASQMFGETEIRVTGPTSRWDVTIEPFLADQNPEETSLRHLDIGERFLLSRVPFIHRVPRMRAYASGVIEQEGRRHSFDRAIVYQAKNHGHGFPDEWIWIHAGAFREDDNLAIEAGWMRFHGGEAALVRISTPTGVRFLASWGGDEVNARRDGDHYSFRGAARDGSLRVSGEGRHGEAIKFEFPTPDGGRFDNDECLVGELAVDYGGRRLTTNMAALALARRIPPPAGQEFDRQ
ncbi:MAG TPA: tocopherol cyclase family protein [Thermoanaerobaculia bacterium]|nr:tocopherol cyclase family protein [Thermoanaerobaculia bacterium]